MGMNTRYVKEYFYKKKIRSMFVWNLEIIAVILLAAAFSWFFCRSVVVQEGSMEPTLVPGERVLMDSAWYRLSSPKRGDIIESDLTYTIQPTNMTSTPRDLQNHHALLFQDGQWGYKGAFAGKTGYTDEAHNTLVTAAKRGNMTLVCVVLTCDNLDYINDTRTVLDFGYDNFTHYTLKNAKKESLSGVVTLPKNAKIETATYTDPDGASVEEPYTRQYFFDDHFIGTAEVSAPGTVSDSSSVSSDSSEETDSTDIPTPEETKKISFLSTLLYILLGLNGVAFLILIIVVINNARKRRKRRNRRRNNRH